MMVFMSVFVAMIMMIVVVISVTVVMMVMVVISVTVVMVVISVTVVMVVISVTVVMMVMVMIVVVMVIVFLFLKDHIKGKPFDTAGFAPSRLVTESLDLKAFENGIKFFHTAPQIKESGNGHITGNSGTAFKIKSFAHFKITFC